MSYASIIATFLFAENLVLWRLLGVSSAVVVSRSADRAVAAGAGILFVSSLSGVCTWAAFRLALEPLGVPWLQTAVFMLVAAGLARFMEALSRAVSPCLHAVLSPHIDEIMASSVVLGVCLLALRGGYDAMQSFVAAAAGAGGFCLAAGVLASIGGELELEWVPRPLRGAPIALISAGLLALAFTAFEGLAPGVPPG